MRGLHGLSARRTESSRPKGPSTGSRDPSSTLIFLYQSQNIEVEVCRDKYLFLQSRMILDDQVELVLRVSCTETLCNTLKGGTTSCMQKQCKICIILQKSNFQNTPSSYPSSSPSHFRNRKGQSHRWLNKFWKFATQL